MRKRKSSPVFGIVVVAAIALIVPALCKEKREPPSEDAPPEKFSLSFGDDFDAGMNFVDDFGISIVLAVDVSGSMADSPASGGDRKYVQATNALVTVSDYLKGLAEKQRDLKIQVALLRFSDKVEVVLPMTLLDDGGYARLRQMCVPANFAPGGGTAIGAGLQKGSELLAQSGTIFNSLIVVTDGENNRKPEPADVIAAIYSNRNNKSSDAMKVRTSTQILSFIGFDVASPQFDLYHQMGGRITSASNQTELEGSLKALLEADITKLE